MPAKPEPDNSHRHIADSETSSHSFLQYLRETLRPYVGLTSFTEGARHEMVQDDVQDAVHPVPAHSRDELLGAYLEATSGLLELFSTDELADMYRSNVYAHDPPGWGLDGDLIPATDVALAIGAQLREPFTCRAHSTYYFRNGREAAFKTMLGRQNLSMVRLFTLLAFYMIGACQRDTASMYLGVAAKAACVLSLHRASTYSNSSESESSSNRARIWNSLRNVDVLSSFIFGKPKSLPAIRQSSSQTHLSFEYLGNDNLTPFNSIVKGCSLLEEIVDELSSGKILHVPTAESLLEKLQSWSQSLPTSLRKVSFTGDANVSRNALRSITSPTGKDAISQGDLSARQKLAGALHVSCIYYFAVILISRPFLIAYLLSRLRGRAPDQLIPNPDEASDMAIKNSTISKMAQLCVSAAMRTAATCAAAHRHGYSFGNLCLLKAWVFGAGLVLGFSKFAGEPRKDIDEAFEQVNTVLESIATQSPQAGLYRETLEAFRESIAKWHDRVETEIKRTVQHYMDDILVIHGSAQNQTTIGPNFPSGAFYTTDTPQSYTDDHPPGLDAVGVDNAAPWLEGWAGGTPQSSTQVLRHLGFGDVISDYESYDDPFFNFEPFEKLFYSVE
ncbi:hypothetical protein PV08_02289 [Exophiala spinifera]|uniref:Xylanolytic transcriptional activator regulatory domain-containing protein n=1 Tax=Exophiala spinifera TaxID=91928 RepID=A0A0D1ZZC2_9EURO|nr:uncharacterized protein PV08_02289 [Exophiala spinifera]KIW18002.1 hypothetical protein PV08_02289 [Exophiala spinifera]